MQMTKLRKENAATANPHSQLLQKYAKFQDEMNRVLIHWTEYCQPTETSKDGKVRKNYVDRFTGSVLIIRLFLH